MIADSDVTAYYKLCMHLWGPVSSCLATSGIASVMAVRFLEAMGAVFTGCQTKFFSSWGTFNAVGEFVTQRNHRVLSVPLVWNTHCAHTRARHIALLLLLWTNGSVNIIPQMVLMINEKCMSHQLGPDVVTVMTLACDMWVCVLWPFKWGQCHLGRNHLLIMSQV